MVNERTIDPVNLAPPPSIDTAILLASVSRAVTHVETLAPAAATATSRRKVTLYPTTDTTADEFIVITGISTQGIEPRQIIITAKDLNRANFRLLLSPDLFVPELLLVGNASEGVILTFESASGAAVPIVIRAATMKAAEFRAIFGSIRRIQVAAKIAERNL